MNELMLIALSTITTCAIILKSTPAVYNFHFKTLLPVINYTRKNALQIIFRLGVAFLLSGFLAIIGLPLVYYAGYRVDIWDDLPAQALVVRDNMYNTYSIMPIALAFIMIIWGVWAVTRRGYNEYG